MALHDWTLDPGEAVALQTQLRERVQVQWDGRYGGQNRWHRHEPGQREGACRNRGVFFS